MHSIRRCIMVHTSALTDFVYILFLSIYANNYIENFCDTVLLSQGKLSSNLCSKFTVNIYHNIHAINLKMNQQMVFFHLTKKIKIRWSWAEHKNRKI